MAGVKLSNGINPSRNLSLDNGVKPSAADFEENYEKRGPEKRTDTGNQGGDMGTNLDKAMDRKYTKKKFSRHKEFR